MKTLTTVLIAVIIAATMVMTCPDKEAHITAINNELSVAIDEKMNETLNEKSEGDELSKGIGMFVSTLAGGIVKSLAEQRLILKNYFVCSVGQFNTEDGAKTVSVGLLGHVFTFVSAEDFR